jgi:predicted DNA-binding transcriptional regulator AlpA
MPRDIVDSLIDWLDELPVEQAAQVLAAGQAQLAARLLANGAPGSTSESSGDRLLTAKDTAPRCGHSADWLYRHADSLPFVVRVGRSVRFSEAGLQKWIRSRSGR